MFSLAESFNGVHEQKQTNQSCSISVKKTKTNTTKRRILRH